MKKMLKRADGSKSQRGLWDNIRAKAVANKKAGKKGKAPSKDMLEQEAKIKAEMKMGGDWMQESKELKFGGPSKRKKYQTAPPPEEDIKLPTDATATPKYTFKGSYESKSSGESRGGRIAGSGKGFGQKQACIGESCGKVVAEGSSYAGGSGTNYTGKGAQGLSMKPQIDKSRIVKLTKEQQAEQNAKYQAAQDAMAVKQAERQAKREANAAAYKAAIAPKEEVVYDFKSVYANPRDLTPIRMNKTGGKRKSTKK